MVQWEEEKAFKEFFVIPKWYTEVVQEISYSSVVSCHVKQILFSRSRIQWVVSLAPYYLTKVCKAIFLQLATPTHIYTQKQQKQQQHDCVPKISEMCHEKLGRTLKRSQKVVLSLVGGHKRYFYLTNHLAFRVLSLCTNSLSNETLISPTDLAGVLKTFIYSSRNHLLNENFICIFHPIFTHIPPQNSRQVLQHISTLRCPSGWFLT